MQELLKEIRKCKVCEPHLPLGANPILSACKNSKIAIIGQAPGLKVHKSGKPWDDQSGKLLRIWLGVTDEEFYNNENFAIIPMGFCYPGRGKSGDLPPRKECAPLWHNRLFLAMDNLQLIVLTGMYSQKYYLKEKMKSTLTETVKCYEEYLPKYYPMPHPSPRNRIWLSKNQWFEQENVQYLKNKVNELLRT